MSTTSPWGRQGGLTLIELIMFMVIMGVAAAGVLQVMNMSTKNSADPLRRKQALMIAEAYMEEIQQARFSACDPADANAATATIAAVGAAGDTTRCAALAGLEDFGPETGNARPYDNVNDYVTTNYATVIGTQVRAFAVAGKDVDVANNVMGAGLGNTTVGGFTTTLALNVVNGLGPAAKAVSSTADPLGMNALRITITTSYGPGAGDVVVLDGYRTRYAPDSVP